MVPAAYLDGVTVQVCDSYSCWSTHNGSPNHPKDGGVPDRPGGPRQTGRFMSSCKHRKAPVLKLVKIGTGIVSERIIP